MRPGPRVYLDENVHPGIGEALRERGFTVVTPQTEGLLGAEDERQLEYTASRGWLLLTHNRRHFRRWHQTFLDRGKSHGGIALLPQESKLEARKLRAAMLLDWIATLPERQSRLSTWGELQALVEQGYRLPGYTERDVELVLGTFSS